MSRASTDVHERQAAAAVLMIRPRRFASNPETAATNRFQSAADADDSVARRAEAELDTLAAALDRAGVEVHVFAGRDDAHCPDEIFPNNWVSFHADGTVVLYPMMAASRRRERRMDVLAALAREGGYRVGRLVDLCGLERRASFLEGTGSLVLDRPSRVAYACLSPRTERAALDAFAARLGYEVVAFDALDAEGHPIYHTNVAMSVGTGFAVVCAAAIRDAGARADVLGRLADSGREVIEIRFEQMAAFAGNILELCGRDGPVIALSARALASLEGAARRALERHAALVAARIDAVEKHGGGSVRCMLAEVHLPKT